jgi:hypothetical protein
MCPGPELSANRKLSRKKLYLAVSRGLSDYVFAGRFQYRDVARPNQYFSTQVVAISTFWNYAAGSHQNIGILVGAGIEPTTFFWIRLILQQFSRNPPYEVPNKQAQSVPMPRLEINSDLVLFFGGLNGGFFALVLLLFRWPRLDGRLDKKSRSS